MDPRGLRSVGEDFEDAFDTPSRQAAKAGAAAAFLAAALAGCTSTKTLTVQTTPSGAEVRFMMDRPYVGSVSDPDFPVGTWISLGETPVENFPYVERYSPAGKTGFFLATALPTLGASALLLQKEVKAPSPTCYLHISEEGYFPLMDSFQAKGVPDKFTRNYTLTPFPRYSLRIESEPPGAGVELLEQEPSLYSIHESKRIPQGEGSFLYRGTTPLELHDYRDKDGDSFLTVRLTVPGYETRTVTLPLRQASHRVELEQKK